MAFGFGFNKQKVLSAAEKCVQQGKLPNAISEYEKILKADPKDLTVMNTVGDLHARLGATDKAAECFKSVGDAYASQGFTVKAIAMYKKLSKLKSSTECILRLAELYTQQGLFNDARAQYLLVAEDFLKTGQLDQAVKIFEKTLEMDPENVAMRTKLAEVYIRMGKKPDAWKILTAAAETLRAKGQLAAADEILQRMLKLEPGNSYALVLRGRAALDAGDNAAAIAALTKVADLDTNADGLKTLFQAYLRAKNLTEARSVASKLVQVHNDGSAIIEYVDALMDAQQYREALQVFEEHADRLLRNDAEKLIESLRSIVGYVKDDPQALETVLALYLKAGETTHLTEIYELMAHAYVQNDEPEKARQYYHKLMELEPANPMHAQNYKQVAEKQGTSTVDHCITSEEGGALVDELEATAPFIEQEYDDPTTLALRAAVTDAELFISYNMPAKALDPLISVLPKAPRDLRINQKLAALQTRAGKFTEAAACCRTLESLYHDAGHSEEASRYGDIAAKYEQRGGVASGGATEIPFATATAVAPHATQAQEFEISAPVVDDSEYEAHAPTSAAAQSEPVVSATPSGVFFHVPGAASAPAEQPEAAWGAAAPMEMGASPSGAGAESSAVDPASEWEEHLEIEPPATAHAHEAEASPEVMLAASATHSPEPPAEPEAETVSSAPSASEEAMEEVRFYLGQGMVEQADAALAKLETQSPDSPELAVLRLGVDSAKQGSAVREPEAEIFLEETEPPESHAGPEAEAPALEVAEAEPVAVPTAHTPQPWPQTQPVGSQPVPQIVAEPDLPVLQGLVSDLEASLGDNFLDPDAPKHGEHVPVETAPELVHAEPVHAEAQEFRSGSLDDFVSDLEASLGVEPVVSPEAAPVAQVAVPLAQAAAASAGAAAHSSFMVPAATPAYASAAQAPVAYAPAAHTGPISDTGVDLADMFGELKQELEGDSASTDEDPETHYNLGVAFREMGLLDEAIGEFQKVTQSAAQGHTFPQLMQTYTWLAQCFLDKGIPQAAIRWYETALKLPNIDQETRTALHYELASSWENAGNKTAALNNFLEVYGSNIDYRDVGERIKALRP